MPKIFISYRRGDTQYQADRLHGLLKDVVDAPEDIFIDVDSIPIGVDFVQYLDEQVARCDVLLALIGANWLEPVDRATGERRIDDPRDFVRVEIASALKRGIPVAPVLFDNATFPSEHQLPDDLKQLARRNGAQVRRLSFDADVERLIRGLNLSRRERSVAQPIQQRPVQQANVALSKTFTSFSKNDLASRQRFYVEGFERAGFIVVHTEKDVTWAVAHIDESGRRSFVNMGDFEFPDKSYVTVEQLAVSRAVMKSNSSLAERCELIDCEFGASAAHADFEDVKRAASVMGPVNLVEFIELRKVRNPEISAIDGVPHWNQGPFVTYNYQTAVEGRSYFIASHDGVAVNDWHVVETISNHLIDLGRWYDNRPALVRISNSYLLHAIFAPEPPYKMAFLGELEAAFEAADAT